MTLIVCIGHAVIDSWESQVWAGQERGGRQMGRQKGAPDADRCSMTDAAWQSVLHGLTDVPQHVHMRCAELEL